MNVRIVMLLVVAITLTACDHNKHEKPIYPKVDSPKLTTTISSDGKLVAALDRLGAEKPRLRIKWVDQEGPWQELDVPPYTNDVRFGLTGYGLLLTHRLPGEKQLTQLSRWNVSDLQKSSEIIYIDQHLAFPVEVNPGQVLVRACKNRDTNPNSCSTTGGGTFWLLVSGPTKGVQVTPSQISLGYGQPSVTEDGFFWFDRYHIKDKESERLDGAVLAFALPGGKEPEPDISRFHSSTIEINCDYKTQRCLQTFHAGINSKTGYFIYDLEIVEGQRRCHPMGLAGWSDGQTITPNGNAGVMSLANSFDGPRHVVVLRFKPGQCEPTSVIHLNF